MTYKRQESSSGSAAGLDYFIRYSLNEFQFPLDMACNMY